MATKKDYTGTYNLNSNATLYVIMFILNGNVYAIETAHIANAWTVWAKSSTGQKKLRLNITAKIAKRLIKMDTCTYIGKASEIYAGCSNTGTNNRGWRTEQTVCKILGIPWIHRNDEKAWYEDSDVIIGNVRIQVKFQNGSIASKKSIASFM